MKVWRSLKSFVKQGFHTGDTQEYVEEKRVWLYMKINGLRIKFVLGVASLRTSRLCSEDLRWGKTIRGTDLISTQIHEWLSGGIWGRLIGCFETQKIMQGHSQQNYRQFFVKIRDLWGSYFENRYEDFSLQNYKSCKCSPRDNIACYEAILHVLSFCFIHFSSLVTSANPYKAE